MDFRDLVKDLATGLKARVELKQVGARDEAKLVGGLGICGREFCCSSFLREFVPVSIKMAKNQNLALNPAKVSGGCGRLLCCLTYENDIYTELRKTLPSKGVKVRVLDDGAVGTVLKTDYLNQLLTVSIVSELGEGKILNVLLKNVEVLDKHAAAVAQEPEDVDMSEAEAWGEDLDIGALVKRPEQKSGGNDRGRSDQNQDRRGPQPAQEQRQSRQTDQQRQPSGQQDQRHSSVQSTGQSSGQQSERGDPNQQREGGGKRKRRRKRKKNPGGGEANATQGSAGDGHSDSGNDSDSGSDEGDE